MTQLTTTDVELFGKKLIDNFNGVYSVDTLPKSSKKNLIFIANIDSSNLPGSHWIGVIIRQGIGYVFDPFGHAPPLKLTNWMSKHCTKWNINTRQIQPIFSQLCGYFCLHFLYFASLPILKDASYNDIIKLMYPTKYSPFTFEQTIIDFKNLTLD